MYNTRLVSGEIDRLRREAEAIIELTAKLQSMEPDEETGRKLREIRERKLERVYARIDQQRNLEERAKRSVTQKEILSQVTGIGRTVDRYLNLDGESAGTARTKLPKGVRELVHEAVMARPGRGEASEVTHQLYTRYEKAGRINPATHPFETVRSYVYRALKAYDRGDYVFIPE